MVQLEGCSRVFVEVVCCEDAEPTRLFKSSRQPSRTSEDVYR